MSPDELKNLIRTVPDFPQPGVQFRDITTLIGHGRGLRASVEHLANRARQTGADAIAGMEARGFIFGAAVAAHMGIGFVPIRKPGKLPVATLAVDYELEYGTDRLEVDSSGIGEGQNVVMVDDLIATGGTALAAAQLLKQAGARLDHALFVIDLPDLGGAKKLRDAGLQVQSLMEFDGD